MIRARRPGGGGGGDEAMATGRQEITMRRSKSSQEDGSHCSVPQRLKKGCVHWPRAAIRRLQKEVIKGRGGGARTE